MTIVDAAQWAAILAIVAKVVIMDRRSEVRLTVRVKRPTTECLHLRRPAPYCLCPDCLAPAMVWDDEGKRYVEGRPP